MTKFIKKYQNIINSKDAKQLGFEKTKEATGKMLTEFFEDIVETVMSKDNDKKYLIQWAISEVEEEKEDAA